jgi:type I restriction enzyme R subunit
MPTPEEKAREIIDSMLEAAGWSVQSYRNMNPSAGLGLAATEFPDANGPALGSTWSAVSATQASRENHTE